MGSDLGASGRGGVNAKSFGGRWLARKFLRGYQLTFSALIGRTCRYLPTCSEYTDTAIDRFGIWPGIWIGMARIARCRPGGANGYDPVPDALPVEASWVTPWRYGDWRGKNIEISLEE